MSVMHMGKAHFGLMSSVVIYEIPRIFYTIFGNSEEVKESAICFDMRALSFLRGIKNTGED